MKTLRAAWMFLALLGICSDSFADEFRIESKVYVAKEKDPVVESLTLFKSGFVYDYLADPPHTAVFDRGQKRFVLLDSTNRIKTEVKAGDIQAFAEEIQTMAFSSKSPLVQFCAKPRFDVSFVPSSNVLLLSSPLLNYRVDAEEVSPNAAEQVREFTDWFAQLNVMIDPHAMLPFARMALNQELDSRNLIAKSVRLEQGTDVIRSQHDITWKLLRKDEERITQTGTHIAVFKLVPFNEFRARGQASAGKGNVAAKPAAPPANPPVNSSTARK